MLLTSRPGSRPRGRRSMVVITAVAIVAGMLLLLAAAPEVHAADPSAGYDVAWSVTRPDATVRSDDAIAVGDDLDLTYAAVDGTPVTDCRVRLAALGGELMESPGVVTDGACHLAVRLPAFPDPAERDQYANDPDVVQLDLCVWTASIAFDDGQARSMAGADQGQPRGRTCNNFVDGQDPNVLAFRVDPSGTRRAFQSEPFIVSWDPADWGSDMQPFRFGETWHWEIPGGIGRCRLSLNGSWATQIRPRADPGCTAWDLRLPGVLPAALPWAGGPGDWAVEMLVDYSVQDPGPSSWTISHARLPMDASDGVFESNLASIFPVDLATTRFVTEGTRWKPAFQVSGATASSCTLTFVTVPPGWPTNPIQYDDFEAAVDGKGVCTFDLDPLGSNEEHQYWVHPNLTADDDPNLQYGADIIGIAAPEPPVIDEPVAEPGGDTEIGVDPGAGQGLAVDLEVTPDATSASSADAEVAAVARSTAAATCTGRALSTDLGAGGAIPHLATSCNLPAGAYTANAQMVDAAGVVTTASRSFEVLPAPAHPVVAGRFPGSGVTGVARDVRPTVVFDVPVNGVSASSFRLHDVATGATVAATVGYNGATRRATLKPAALLGAGRTYRLSLTSAITSGPGRALVPIDWTFKVTTDATAPTIVGRAPASGAVGVSRQVVVAVRFSEAVRNVTSSTVQLRDLVAGTYVPATIAYDPVTRRATLDPTAPLAAGRPYLAIVRSSISDRVGNPLATTTWSFTTGP
jgi:Bacterial Ig-like domain